MTEEIMYLVIVVLMGYWCSTIAKKNERSVGLAWFMGIIFGITAVIVYYCMGKSQAMRDRELEIKIKSINKNV